VLVTLLMLSKDEVERGEGREDEGGREEEEGLYTFSERRRSW